MMKYYHQHNLYPSWYNPYDTIRYTAIDYISKDGTKYSTVIKRSKIPNMSLKIMKHTYKKLK